MGDLDPRIEKVRRIGIGVFVALAVAAIPIGIHIVKTYDSPELWLTLLGAVFMLLLICLYALETALLPIPKSAAPTPSSIDPDAVTELHEPEDDEERTEYIEPTEALSEKTLAPIGDDTAPTNAHEFDEAASNDAAAILVEVEEFPTHPPFSSQSPGPLEDQSTELDPDRAHIRNPDAPILTVPNAALRAAETNGTGEDG